MKKDSTNIENEIKKTLQSLDGMEKVRAKPFFYTRLEAKMQKKDSFIPNRSFYQQWKPVWSIVMLLLVISLNLYTFIATWKVKKKQNQEINTILDYQPSTNTIYDLNLLSE